MPSDSDKARRRRRRLRHCGGDTTKSLRKVDSWKSDTYPIILFKRQIIMKDRSIAGKAVVCHQSPLPTGRPSVLVA